MNKPSTRFTFFLSTLLLLGITILFLPLASNSTVPSNSDYIFHIAAIMQAKLALLQGQFPLRYAPTGHLGLPYPIFQFYSPTSYTIAGEIHRWFASNPFVAYKLTLMIAVLIGTIYFYRLAYWLVQSRFAAGLACIVYMLSPYIVIIVNQLAAFNETLALCIVPAALLYTMRAYHEPKSLILFLQTSIAWYLLATTHIVTFACTAVFTGLLLLALLFENQSQWRKCLYTSALIVFGVSLAAWYLIPVLSFAHYLTINHIMTDVTSFYQFSPSFKQMVIPFPTHYLINSNMSYNTLTVFRPALGLPIILAFGTCLYAYYQQKTIISTRANALLPCLLALFIIGFFFAWSPINIWKILPHSALMIQYSYRLIGQLLWIGSLLFAWMIAWVFPRRIKIKTAVIIATLLFLNACPWLLIKAGKTNIHEGLSIFSFDSDYYLNLQNPKFVTEYESILLHSSKLETDKTLDAIKAIHIPVKDLLVYQNPHISLHGIIPAATNTKKANFVMNANHKSIASIPLKAGEYHWQIPFHKALMAEPTSLLTLEMQFTHPSHGDAPKIPYDEITLAGLLDETKLIKYADVQPTCQYQHGDMQCKIFVPNQINRMEIPMPYFPGLYTIHINGQNKHYFSLYSKDMLITTLHPEPGIMNTVELHFQGNSWSNYFSMAGWQLVILLSIYLFIRNKVLIRN